jgi:hypothetical protein
MELEMWNVAADPTVVSSRLWNWIVVGREGLKVVLADQCEQAVDEKAVVSRLQTGLLAGESAVLDERRLGDSSEEVAEFAMGWR